MDTQTLLVVGCIGLGLLAVSALIGCVALRGRARKLEQQHNAVDQRYRSLGQNHQELEQQYKTIEQTYKDLQQRYSAIASVDAAVAEAKRDLDRLNAEHAPLRDAQSQELKTLEETIRQARERNEALKAELFLLE